MYSFVLTIATKSPSLWQPSVELRKNKEFSKKSFRFVEKYLGVSVFAQMTLVTLGRSLTVGTTALVTQHPSVVGKTEQLKLFLSIRTPGRPGASLGNQTEVSQGWLLVFLGLLSASGFR